MSTNKQLTMAIMLAVIMLLGFAVTQLNAGDRLAAEFQAEHGTKVVMYGASWCGVCAQARQELTQAGVDYIELDVEASAEGNRQFRKLGGVGVPVFIVDGQVIRGYDRRRIWQLLQP